MDTQTFINIAIGLIGALGGWVLNLLRDSMTRLQKTDSELASKVQSIEVMVAGQYVRREDFDKFTAAIFTKLDKIHDMLSNKADK